MPTGCEGLITADILFDCDNPSIGGLETDVLIVNTEDIDRSATTFDAANKMKMTNLALKAGKVGYKLEGVKQLNGFNWELVKKEMGVDKFKHVFSGVILNPSATNKLQLYNFSQGGKYVVIVEQKWKGAANVEAFTVVGYTSGLELTTATRNIKESDGAILFSLESTEGFEEPKPDVTLLETDYAITKTAFDAKFVAA